VRVRLSLLLLGVPGIEEMLLGTLCASMRRTEREIEREREREREQFETSSCGACIILGKRGRIYHRLITRTRFRAVRA
jgi:hypothetical protein